MLLERLVVAIEGDLKGLRNDLKEADTRFVAFGKRIAGVTAGLIGVSTAMSAIGRTSRDAMRLDSLARGLSTVAGSSQEAHRQLARLRDLAMLPGLGFEQVVQGSTNLQAAGLSAQLAEDALREMGNALAAVGRGKEDLDGVILALTQIASKGKVTAEEINQIAERVPQIRVVLKEAFGTAATEEIQALGITAEEFIRRTVAAMEDLGRATKGPQAEAEDLGDSFQRLSAELGEIVLIAGSPAMRGLTTVFSGLADVLDRATKSAETLADRIGGVRSFTGMSPEDLRAEVALLERRQKILREGLRQNPFNEDNLAFLRRTSREIQAIQEILARPQGGPRIPTPRDLGRDVGTIPRNLTDVDLFPVLGQITGPAAVRSGTNALAERLGFSPMSERQMKAFAKEVENTAANLKPLTKESGALAKKFGEFGRGVLDEVKARFDPTQILSGAAANLLSGAITSLASTVLSALGDLFGPSALEHNTAAIRANTEAIFASLRGQAGGTVAGIQGAIGATLRGPATSTLELWQALGRELEAVGLTMDDFGAVLRDLGLEMPTTQAGFEQLLGVLETNPFVGLSGRLDLARRRMGLLDIDDPAGQFAELQRALAQSLPGGISGLGTTVARLGLDSIGGFAEGVLGQIEAGTFDVSQLGDLSIDEFLSVVAELESLGDAASGTAEAIDSVANSINSPSGFKYALRKFQATDADSGLLSGILGGTHGSFTTGRGGDMTIGTVNIQAAPGDDGRALYRKFTDELRAQMRLGGADDFTVQLEGLA